VATSVLVAGLPPDLDLDDNYIIRVDAIDPTTGATVAGVNVTYLSIFAVNLGGTPVPDTIPLLTPLLAELSPPPAGGA
jgi:hypothetical protein